MVGDAQWSLIDWNDGNPVEIELDWSKAMSLISCLSKWIALTFRKSGFELLDG